MRSVKKKPRTAAPEPAPRSQAKRRSDCPISFGLDLFGDRWTLLVLRDLLMRGKKTFGEILAGEEGIATNVLTERLTRLEAEGLVVRRPHPESRVKIEYYGTEKARDLLPVLLEIAAWSSKYDPDTGAPPAFIARIHKDRARLIKELRAALPDA
jgi:DNA-binding HxlR family transcriptional regulator